MSLKLALQADLAAKRMNLGHLADQLGITQQSVSKWIAKDEIPKDRLEEVLNFLSPSRQTATYLLTRAQESIRGAMGAKAPPQPGDDEDDHVKIYMAGHGVVRDHQDRAVKAVIEQRRAPTMHERSSAIRMARARATANWVARLSDRNRANAQTVMEINGAPRQFDYLSSKLAVLVRATPILNASQLISVAVPLMLLKTLRPATQCWLALLPRSELGMEEPRVTMDEDTRRLDARRMVIVKQDLEALGVTVMELPAAEELAVKIEAAENPNAILVNPPFTYEDYPEEL